MSPQGDYDPTKVSVKFVGTPPETRGEVTAVLYPGTDPQGRVVVEKIRVPYELVFPSGRTEAHVLEFLPPAEISDVILAGAYAAVAAVLEYEGLTTVYAPPPPAPLPEPSAVELAATATGHPDVTAVKESP